MKKKLDSRQYFAIIIAVAVLLVLLNGLGWLPIKDIARDLTRPLASSLTSAGQAIGSKFSEIGKIGSLNDENQALASENRQLREEITKLKELDNENSELRKQLNFPLKNQRNLVGADVIGFQPDSVRKLIQINRGSNDGIKAGQVVVSEGNLVGKIQSTTAKTASVLLLGDANFRVLGIDQNTRAPGIAKGQIGGSVLFDRIPENQTVNEGDIIITSGSDGEFPPDLIIGKVASIHRPGESIFKQAEIEITYDPNQLKLVRVIAE